MHKSVAVVACVHTRGKQHQQGTHTLTRTHAQYGLLHAYRACACGLCLRHVNLEGSPLRAAPAPQRHLCTLCTCILLKSKYPHQLPTRQPAATQCLQQHDTG